MNIKKIIIILLFLIFSFSGFSAETEKTLTLSAAGIKKLNVDCGAGYLKILGKDGLDRIEVKAHIVIDRIDPDEMKEFTENHITLSLKKRGTKAILISKIRYSSFSSIFKRGHKLINLDVRIPKHLVLDIDDGSGLIEISDTDGDIKLDDGSGSIEIDNIKGKISIDDGSGSTDIKNVFNDVEIDDGSGNITIESVTGSVEIDDGSGSIDVEHIKGDVSVRDGSGTMKIYKITGSVTVNDGSGDIIIDRVEKDVIIIHAGSGGLKLRNIKGKVSK